jgi:CubicO group peptidase (beta-lactamase class C family)
MFRKTVMVVLFVFVLVPVLVACGGAAETPTPTLVEVTPLPPATDEPPPTAEPMVTDPPPTEPPTAEPTATDPSTADTPEPEPTSSETLAERMDAFVTEETRAGRFSGAVLVLHEGEVLLSKGYGSAVRVGSTPNTTSTRFPLGTLTMPFTAVAVLQLMEQGKLALEDSICAYLDDCPAGWANVEIHHLLSQSSGISREHAERALAVTMGEASAEAARLHSESRVIFEPGSQWPGLQSSDFLLLGLIIENASGQPYADFLADNIFGPLGMNNTSLTNDTTNMALGYREGDSEPQSPGDLVGKYAGEGLSSNLEDMTLFSQALLAGELLSPESMGLMVNRAVVMSTGWHTGYGWFLSDFDGRFFSASMPSLGITGYNGAMVILPEEDLAWVILSNDSSQEQGYGGDTLTLMVLDEGE